MTICHHASKIQLSSNLEKFSINGWPEGKVYEKMAQLGIMRPLLIKKIIDLRNIVAHEFTPPMNKDKAAINELLEITWYFLRSTDAFLSRHISEIILLPLDFSYKNGYHNYGYDYEEEYDRCFLVEISPHNEWKIEFSGQKLPLNLFSKYEKEGWLEIAIEEFDDLQITLDLIDAHNLDLLEGIPSDLVKTEREKRFDDYLLSGELVKKLRGILLGPPKAIRHLVERYFELYMF